MAQMGIPDRREGLAVGTNVGVKGPGGQKSFFRITKRDNIFLLNSRSALSSGSTESYFEISDLDPPQNQIFQIHTIIIDGNVEIQFKQPAATNRWGTQRSPTGGYLLDKYRGELVNIWISEDFPPNIQQVNNTDVSITTSLWFIGWRYEVEKLPSEPAQFVEVAVGPPTQ